LAEAFAVWVEHIRPKGKIRSECGEAFNHLRRAAVAVKEEAREFWCVVQRVQKEAVSLDAVERGDSVELSSERKLGVEGGELGFD